MVIKVFSVKMEYDKIIKINKELDKIATIKGFDKGKSLNHIIDKYIELTTLKDKQDFEPTYKVNISAPYPCTFLEKGDDGWMCLQQMSTKKKPIPLGLDTERVKTLCQACSEGRELEISNRQQIIFEKSQMSKYIKALKRFQKLSEDGFSITFTMCAADSLNGNLQYSTDGTHLPCIALENKIVNINDTCKQKVDPKTYLTPCQYLIREERKANIDETPFKEVKDAIENIENESRKMNEIKQLPNTSEVKPDE